MTIHHETEIVTSGFDGTNCTYTIERDGKRWTARVPLADLEKLGPMPGAARARRDLVARALETAMRGEADG